MKLLSHKNFHQGNLMKKNLIFKNKDGDRLQAKKIQSLISKIINKF